MNHIEKLIDRYLSKRTQYAIQLIGAWGSGKTHYYREILQKKIENTVINKAAVQFEKDKPKYYVPIYVSLFGLKTLDDIQAKILQELIVHKVKQRTRGWSFLHRNDKDLKISTSIYKLLLRGVLILSRIKQTNELIVEMNKAGRSVINEKQLVICFDDLERKSKSLEIEDVTGLINSLVEEGIKILIICNEDVIKEAVYSDFKEKIVGATVEFVPNSEEVTNNIINTRYESKYQTFLESYKNIILEILSLNNNNYRHLIYALDCLQDIHQDIWANVSDNKTAYFQSLKEEMPAIVKFVLATSVEYKASRLSYSNRNQFSSYESYSLMNQFSDNPNMQVNYVTDLTIANGFFEKYYKDKGQYYYYNSAFTFVTGAQEFDFKKFETEIKGRLGIQLDGNISEPYKLLNELEYHKTHTLSSDEYKNKTIQLIEYAKQGKYKLNEYFTINYYARRFDNPIKLDLNSVLNDLLNGMALSAKKLTSEDSYNQASNIEAISTQSEQSQEAIRKRGIELLEKVKEENESRAEEEVLNTIINNLDEFKTKYQSDRYYQNQVERFPIFKLIDVSKFVDNVIKANTDTLDFLRVFFKRRYEIEIGSFYREEEKSINQIQLLLDKWVEVGIEDTRKGWFVKHLANQLSDIDIKYNPRVV